VDKSILYLNNTSFFIDRILKKNIESKGLISDLTPF
jgi:hypothetical protein